ncbi:T9SS type A sorting domain-containing protein [Arcicella aurantiaca]|nr:T9SS type A sorting domain-containing protein [Arcicella aurantiaca]
MKKHFLTTAFFLLAFFHIIQAQQATSITLGQVPNNICKGSTISLSFTANGVFDATNSFKVQIRNSYTSAWTDLATEGSSSPLKCTIPANFEENISYYSYYIRIVATKPNIVSVDTYIYPLNSKPNLTLLGLSSSSINPYESVNIRLKGTGYYTKAVLNDSTVLDIGNISNTGDNFIIYPKKTNDYSIAYATNACGRGEVSGTAKLTVNEIGLKLISVTASNCLGGKIQINYSSTEKVSSSNKFKIGLRGYYPDKEYEIDAVEKDGYIEAVLPSFIAAAYDYNVRIISSSPQAVSAWSSGRIFIGDKASAEITSHSENVYWGYPVLIEYKVTGIGPWNIILNDGGFSNISYYPDYTTPNSPYSGLFSKSVLPDKSKSYSIAAFTSKCGVGPVGKNIMDVNVKPGVVIDSLNEDMEICLGDSFTAKYSTFGDNASIVAFVTNNNYGTNNDRIKVPAVFNNGTMKVTLPKNLLDNKNPDSDNFYLGISYGNDPYQVTYSRKPFKIRTLPSVSFNSPLPINLVTKGSAWLQLITYGTGNLSVLLEDSTRQTINAAYRLNNYSLGIPVQVAKTTTFKLKSVSNICGTVPTTDTRGLTVYVNRPADNDITLQNIPTKLCVGEKTKIYFKTFGSFKTENEYKVELTQYGITKIIGTGKSSPIDVVIPDVNLYNNTNYTIRVVASAPTTISDSPYITINTTPSINLSLGSTLEFGTLVDEDVTFNLYGSTGGTINSFVFSDGTTFQGNQQVVRRFKNSTNFSIKSVSNECGIGTAANNSFKINIVPFKLYSVLDNTVYCTDSYYNYNYEINGVKEPNVTFNLQIALQKDSVFTDLVTNSSENPIRFKIPSTLKEGNYLLRLVSNTAVKVYSQILGFQAKLPIKANLTAPDGSNAVSIEGGTSVSLKYSTSGTTPANTILVDDKEQVIRGVLSYDNSQSFTPTKSTTYTLKSLENTCGYGVGTGSVKVTIKPSITVNQLNIYTICSGKDITVNASSFGEFDAGNTFKFTLIDSKKNRYDVNEVSLLSGETKLKIPNNLAFDTYQLEVSSTKPIVTKTFGNNLSVITLPDATISGNTIINSGQQTYISVINNNTKNNPSYYDDAIYVLSNDTQGYTSYGKFVNVNPTKTTTYTLKSITNSCGVGKVSGSATVTVNPLTDKRINTNFGVYSATYVCAGGQQYVYFDTQGIFSATNKFSAQISDKNGENFKDIVSEGDKSPLKVTIPEDLPEGDNYRIRVIASDKDVSSSANIYSLNSFKASTATLDSTTYFFSEGKSVNVKINLTGTSPWSLKFGLEELSAIVYRATASPFTIKLNPLSPISYKIFSVNDSYCMGKVSGTGIVKLELVTANEELSDIEIKLFPNPTNDKVILQSDNYKHTVVQIVDNFGRKILEQNINNAETILDLSGYTSGQYFLQIERENRRKIYKIQKL